MKKMMVSLFSAALMGAGLVGVGAAPAQAACPYTGCVETFTHVNAPDTVVRGDRARICVKVTTGGNGRPKGRVTVLVHKSVGDYHFTDSKRYDGGRECFTTTKLNKRGKYVVKANFDRKAGSGFKDSDQRTVFRVVSG
ncbi:MULTISPECIES: hypothetical protein [unclassified Nocardioides]|uniref:hypothetical protein n=1 Tax=unclassified Nocardioides TaxID=2615069 RepID=UPI0000570DD5|nr:MULTISPECIES: hypothetical protein [unclassified Nocardioides]ABL83722.1 hypothetical protein Noca_4225 [Nocardioides sp. JS614]